MPFIGIDPGQGGGIAAITRHGRVLSAVKMPGSLAGVLNALEYCIEGRSIRGYRVHAALEFVRSSPQMGVASSFTFGRGLGHLEMALAALHIPATSVHPVKWQNALDCRTRGDKNISKAKAEELFPGVKITHAIADALLLAEYLRRLESGVRLTTPANTRTAPHGE